MTASNFSTLPIIPQTLKALEGLGFSSMTSVQAESLPLILARKDVIIQAQTGSGKQLPSASVYSIISIRGSLVCKPW